MFEEYSVKTQHGRNNALNSALFRNKNMGGKNTVIPAALIIQKIKYFNEHN